MRMTSFFAATALALTAAAPGFADDHHMEAQPNIVEIAAIAQEASQRNEAAGVTGALIQANRDCLSAIEGPPKAVRDIIESIWDDRRHTSFNLRDMASTDTRWFDGWPLRRLNASEFETEPDLLAHPGIEQLGAYGGGIKRFLSDGLPPEPGTP